MAISTANPGPYAPPSAILDIIDRYRNRGLAKPITGEVLGRAGVSDSLIPRTLQSLQLLELIDDSGNPTETLESLRRAKEPEYKDQLSAWIRGVYADVLTFVDPSQDDETAIRDAFRSYNPVGQQSRMVTLFLTLCRAAGMRTGEVAKESRPRPVSHKPNTSQSSSTRQKKNEKNAAATSNFGQLPAPIAGLLGALPPQGQGWKAAERAKFIKTFETILDFCYPLSTDEPDDPEK